MDSSALQVMTGEDLDASGAEIGLPRVTVKGGHGFDEGDDSYRRRLLATVIGAAAADATSPRDEDSIPDWRMNLDASGLRTDGPTLAEWVAAGYEKEAYPPRGYASKEPIDPNHGLKQHIHAGQASSATVAPPIVSGGDSEKASGDAPEQLAVDAGADASTPGPDASAEKLP